MRGLLTLFIVGFISTVYLGCVDKTEPRFPDIFTAARKGDLKDLKKHLRRGTPIDAYDDEHSPPLVIAAEYGHKDIVEYLLSEGADPNFARKKGITALHLATLSGHKEVVETLLAHGADPNTKLTVSGTTPLHEAVRGDHYDIVKILLAYGADPDAESNIGTTALDRARMNGQEEIARLLMEHNARKSNQAD